MIDSIGARIVEALYSETLVLADAARGRFDDLRESAPDDGSGLLTLAAADGRDGGALMREALRTNTRVMHCLAWLLNHRAWFAGEITTAQLRRHGRLIGDFPASDRALVARLPHDLATLVHHSERIYARIARLDRAWRAAPLQSAGARGGARQRA